MQRFLPRCALAALSLRLIRGQSYLPGSKSGFSRSRQSGGDLSEIVVLCLINPFEVRALEIHDLNHDLQDRKHTSNSLISRVCNYQKLGTLEPIAREAMIFP